MSVPALLQSLRHGEGFSKLPASFGIMQFRTSKGRTYFGAIHSPSGFNLYQKLNNNSLTVGGSAIALPPQPVSVPSMTALSAVCDNSDGSVTLTFAPAIAATEKVKLFASAAVSGGKSFVKSELRLIGIMDSTSTSPFCRNKPLYCKVWCCWNCWKENFLRHRTSKAHHWPSRSQSGVFHSNCDLNMPSKSVEIYTPSGTVYLIEGAGGVLQINVRFSFANVVDIRIYYSNLSEEKILPGPLQSHNLTLTTEILWHELFMELSERKSVAKSEVRSFKAISMVIP